MCNTATLDIVNNGTDTIILKPEEMLGIVDLRSLGITKLSRIHCNKTKANTTGLKGQIHSVNTLIIHKHTEKGEKSKRTRRKLSTFRSQ